MTTVVGDLLMLASFLNRNLRLGIFVNDRVPSVDDVLGDYRVPNARRRRSAALDGYAARGMSLANPTRRTIQPPVSCSSGKELPEGLRILGRESRRQPARRPALRRSTIKGLGFLEVSPKSRCDRSRSTVIRRNRYECRRRRRDLLRGPRPAAGPRPARARAARRCRLLDAAAGAAVLRVLASRVPRTHRRANPAGADERPRCLSDGRLPGGSGRRSAAWSNIP